MAFAFRTDLPPMEAASVDEIPAGEGWQYEPKWDGFRCLTFRDGDKIELQSKSGQPLARYFPDVVAAVAALKPRQFVLDGEIVVPVDGLLSFDALLQRIHPATSRVKKLAVETPAWLVVFDLLADEKGESLLTLPLRERRGRLEAFSAKHLRAGTVWLSPATTELRVAKHWFGSAGTNLDGLIAKKLNAPYAAGERSAMVKIKPQRTADCVIGGFRYAEKKKKLVGSLLLGLYDDDGRLNHVGFCSGLKTAEKPALTKKLEALAGGTGFTGRAPGGPSRWSTKRSTEWIPLDTKLVVEVSFDHVTAGRFRHGTSLLRWRPDKAPQQCTMDQLRQKSSRALELLKR